jgi:hypothetical protein
LPETSEVSYFFNKFPQVGCSEALAIFTCPSSLAKMSCSLAITASPSGSPFVLWYLVLSKKKEGERKGEKRKKKEKGKRKGKGIVG